MSLQNTIFIYIHVTYEETIVTFFDINNNIWCHGLKEFTDFNGEKEPALLCAYVLIKDFARSAYLNGFSQAFLSIEGAAIEGLGRISDNCSEWITSENIKILSTKYIIPGSDNGFVLNKAALRLLFSESSKIPLKASDNKPISDVMSLQNTIFIYIHITYKEIIATFSDIDDNIWCHGLKEFTDFNGEKEPALLCARVLIKDFARSAYKNGFSQAFLSIEGPGRISDNCFEWITLENIKILSTKYITPGSDNGFVLNKAALRSLFSESSKTPLKTLNDKPTSDLK